MQLIISESKNYIIITCQLEEGRVLSWENLQEIKDEFYPEKDFLEIYPKTDEIINKSNERHLVHVKGLEVPKMCDFEEDADIKIIYEHHLKEDRNKILMNLSCIAEEIKAK